MDDFELQNFEKSGNKNSDHNNFESKIDYEQRISIHWLIIIRDESIGWQFTEKKLKLID